MKHATLSVTYISCFIFALHETSHTSHTKATVLSCVFFMYDENNFMLGLL